MSKSNITLIRGTDLSSPLLNSEKKGFDVIVAEAIIHFGDFPTLTKNALSPGLTFL
jgi:hypothetical protein